MFNLPNGRIPSLLTRSSHLRPRVRLRRFVPPARSKVTFTETIHIGFQESSQARRRIFQAFVYIAAFYVFQRVVLGPLDDIDLPEEETKGARKKQKTKPTPEEVLNGTDEEEDDDDDVNIMSVFRTRSGEHLSTQSEKAQSDSEISESNIKTSIF